MMDFTRCASSGRFYTGAERNPGSNRVDLWELLDSVNLTYYDRLEWLIRTDLRAAVDNLIVERARDEKHCNFYRRIREK